MRLRLEAGVYAHMLDAVRQRQQICCEQIEIISPRELRRCQLGGSRPDRAGLAGRRLLSERQSLEIAAVPTTAAAR